MSRAKLANSLGLHAIFKNGWFSIWLAVPRSAGFSSKQRFKKSRNCGDQRSGSFTVGGGLV